MGKRHILNRLQCINYYYCFICNFRNVGEPHVFMYCVMISCIHIYDMYQMIMCILCSIQLLMHKQCTRWLVLLCMRILGVLVYQAIATRERAKKVCQRPWRCDSNDSVEKIPENQTDIAFDFDIWLWLMTPNISSKLENHKRGEQSWATNWVNACSSELWVDNLALKRIY